MDPRDPPASWPFRPAAHRLRLGRIDWWLIDTGPRDAPALLLLHGLGASGHSFRRMIPGLAARFRVLVPDLPGQGFSRTAARDRLGLAPMAADLAALCDAAGVRPRAVIGHSAGAALALQMALDRPGPAVIGLNAALGQFDGAAGLIFPMLAQGLSLVPLVPLAVARLWGSETRVRRLLAQTGSPLDPEGQAMYLRLVRDPGHVAGALGMMAGWRLADLLAALPRIPAPTLLITGADDRAVAPRVSTEAAARMPKAEVRSLPGGHLLHEEAADGLSGLILDWLARSEDQPKIS